jgi:hypothetical protein
MWRPVCSRVCWTVGVWVAQPAGASACGWGRGHGWTSTDRCGALSRARGAAQVQTDPTGGAARAGLGTGSCITGIARPPAPLGSARGAQLVHGANTIIRASTSAKTRLGCGPRKGDGCHFSCDLSLPARCPAGWCRYSCTVRLLVRTRRRDWGPSQHGLARRGGRLGAAAPDPNTCRSVGCRDDGQGRQKRRGGV